MKKITIFVLFIFLLCLLIPIIFVKSFNKAQIVGVDIIQDTSSITDYNYSQYNTIRLLHSKTGIIEEIKLDEYLYGVVSAEMPADFEMEALKAQAVVARTYTIYKIINNSQKHEGADICDNSNCCQAWISKDDRLARWDNEDKEYKWNRIVEAVNGTIRKNYYI